MKHIVFGLLAVGLLTAQISEANAVTCARGVYRAGCAGPHGAVTTHRGYGYSGRAARGPLLLSSRRARLSLSGPTSRCVAGRVRRRSRSSDPLAAQPRFRG